MGGGKAMPPPETPQAMVTTSSVGDLLDAPKESFVEDSTSKIDAIDRKKLGTRGLRIPLQSERSTTTNTAASSGVQLP